MTWFAVLYVPAPLHSNLGKKLRASLQTRDLVVARQRRHAVLAKFRQQIEDAARQPSPGRNATVDEALLWREALEIARQSDEDTPDEAGDADEIGPESLSALSIAQYALQERGEKLKGPAQKAFADIAYGRATPLLHHVPDWLHQGGQKGHFASRTKVQHERTLTELQGWMERVKLSPTIEAIDKRQAGRFVTECLGKSDRQPKTMARIISTCRSYWTFLLRKGIVPGDKNPWDGQAPPKGASKGTEEATERPFTDAEARRLLDGPADAELADLMPMAALTGMRIEEIYRLEVRDCLDGWLDIRRAKTKAGKRRVPIHPVLATLIARRTAGKDPKAFLFHEAGPLREGRERSMAVSKRFGHYRKRLGVDEIAEGKRRSLVNFHSWRRWFITAAARAGQPDRVVGQLVGHKAQGMTMGVYFGGDLPEQLRACVEAVNLPPVVEGPLAGAVGGIAR